MASFCESGFTDGDKRSAVRTDQGCAAGATGERQSEQPARAECGAVCGRAGLQVAWLAEAVWPLAPRLYADEPAVQARRSGPRLRARAGAADRSGQARGSVLGFDF